ncbi:hypothetical protein ACFFX0_29595 [Citricoccus parietis]|uniref:Uncharacterized protein n=1 Tax=Citricoccus parietis TaxID=592307 RepID=A0ABV5FT63_9MICC
MTSSSPGRRPASGLWKAGNGPRRPWRASAPSPRCSAADLRLTRQGTAPATHRRGCLTHITLGFRMVAVRAPAHHAPDRGERL